MHFVIDIGNTRTKAGLFERGELMASATWEGLPTAHITTWAYNHPITAALFSSSGDAAAALEAALREWGAPPVRLHHGLRLPFDNRYATPETLGRDRIAGVAGAAALHPGHHCLVIDAGTCITLDVLTADGVYPGGNISPGVRMRLRAMHAQTARLPLVAPGPPDDLLGVSTETALRNGAVLGAILEIEAFIERCTARYPEPIVLLTGGDAPLLAPHLKTKIFALPNLVLYGLQEILRLNVEMES